MKKSVGLNSERLDITKSKKQTDNTNYGNIFIASAFSMSWQLAVVVLVPILGGYALDKRAGTSPALLVVGILIALAGSIFVISNAFKQANQKANKR